MNTPQTAVIALGSNLDHPSEKVQAALKAALDVAFVGDCVERMDDDARDCRLAAHDAAALVACDVAAAGGAAGPPPEASSER